MTLKAVIENEADIPETLRDEYAERDGKWYLDLDDTVKVHSAVTPLATALQSLKRDKTNLQSKIQAAEAKLAGLPEDFDPAKYTEAMAELEQLRTDPGNRDHQAAAAQLRDQYEQRIRNMTAEHTRALEEREAALAQREAELGNFVGGAALRQALLDVGVDKKFAKAVDAMLRPQIKVKVDEESGQRVAYVDTDLGEADVKSYVETWAKSDEGKHFISPAQGSGAPGGGRPPLGDNPFTHEQWNVTAQGAMYNKDPAQAERMAKAAGTTIGGPRPAPRRAAA